MEKAVVSKFDPEEHKNNVYDAFVEFVGEFKYAYKAIAKAPPKDLGDDARAAWILQNKRDVFLGKFASRNLQKAFEEVVPEAQHDTITFDDMVKALKTHFDGTRNKTVSNYEFHQLEQAHEDSFDKFVNTVKREVELCSFKCASATCDVPDTMVRDRIIVGTRNDEIRKNALKNQWNLDDLVKNGRALEAATHGAKQIKQEKGSSSPTVARIKKPGKYSRKNKPKQEYQSNKNRKPTQTLKESNSGQCTTCSSRTCKGGKKCIAYGNQCFDCHKDGHFRGAAVCEGKTKAKSHRVNTDSTSSESEEETTSESESDTDTEDSSSRKRTRRLMKCVTKVRRMRCKKRKVRKTARAPRYEVDVVINGQLTKAFADTGADISVTSKEQAKALGLKLCKTKMKIKPYGSKSVKCKQCYIGTIMHGDHVANVCIYVVNQKVETLLSGPVCEELGIIEFTPQPVRRTEAEASPCKNRLAAKYPRVFADRVGRLKNYTVKFYVDENVKPVAERRRPAPYHLREKRDRELAKMEAEDLIEEHHGPAPWISNNVLTPKDDGGTRVTTDMRNVNEAIQPTNIPIPRVEEIKSELAGSKVFSKLDFKSAFHQLELDEESRRLTVFHGSNGRLMRYKVLTMGCTPASGELTKALRPLFQHIAKVHVIHDDVIVATEDEAEHERILDEVLQIIEASGMTLNIKKCMFFKSEVPFWGVLVSDNGIRPDPQKVAALKHASRPANRNELISFLCMVQSNKEFIPLLARKTSHLRQLTKKGKRFKWTKDCQKEFEQLRDEFSEKMLITHFDPTKNTYIQVDAHRSGLSAILLQGETREDAKPVA